MSADVEAQICAPEPKRPATGDAEKQPETSDVHLSEHEGTTKFFVVYNKKPIPLFFNLVSCGRSLPPSLHTVAAAHVAPVSILTDVVCVVGWDGCVR